MKTRLAISAGAVMAMASTVLAETVMDGNPPEIDTVTTPWMAILYALVFVAAAAAVGFKNAHRTHLD